MEERGPVQLPAPGLLGLLQLKADGRGVSKLGDACYPSLEMAGWWLRAKAEVWPGPNSGTIAAAVIDTFQPLPGATPVTIPNGEWWYVLDYTVAFDVAAANSASSLQLAWASTQLGTTKYASLNPAGAAGTSMTGRTAQLLTARDFWLPPGSRLGFWVDEVVGAGGLNVNLTQLRFARCPS